MKIITTLFLILALAINANAQEEKSSNSRVKNIISLKAGITDPLLAVVYERLFTPYLGAEVSIGLIGASIGPKVFLPSLRPNKVNFHTGLIFGSGYFAGGGYGYLPIGINRLTKKNFVISLDLGPQYLFSDEKILPGAAFKIGKAF
jgi:hypothetical protein